MPKMVGETVNVLIESLKPNGEVSGYTDNYYLVFAKGSDELLGKFVDVKITGATRTSLKGEVVA
jgi:tRNA-2-methylthio-N6-dimethylallyladenosine synthase